MAAIAIGFNLKNIGAFARSTVRNCFLPRCVPGPSTEPMPKGSNAGAAVPKGSKGVELDGFRPCNLGGKNCIDSIHEVVPDWIPRENDIDPIDL